jgi:hypothetical protein
MPAPTALRKYHAIACGLTLALAQTSLADEVAPRPTRLSTTSLVERSVPPTYGIGSPPAIEPGPNYHHASTLEQGVLDGSAAVVRAAGQAAYNTAVAAEHAQSARHAAIRNDLVAADARYQYRQLVYDYRRHKEGPRVSHEEAARVARLRAPQRLSAYELDRWGRINWPSELSGEPFANDRQQLHELFVTAAGYGAEPLRLDQVKPVVDRMLTELRKSQTRLSTDRYIAARRFLKALEYETRAARDDVRLAQRP